MCEDVLARLDIDDALMDVHGAARLVRKRLCHERRVAIVREGGFPDRPLEEKDLIRKIDGIAVQQIDFELRRAAFLNDRVDLQILPLGKFVDVVDDLVVFVDGAKAIGLPAGAGTARASHRRLERIIGIGVGFGQIEFEFRGDDRAASPLWRKARRCVSRRCAARSRRARPFAIARRG